MIDQPQRGYGLQPRVAARAATLGNRSLTVPNRNAVASFPDVTFIPLYPVLCQERSDFILEAQFSVRVLLIRNIFLNLLQIRLTHGKVCVAALPFEID